MDMFSIMELNEKIRAGSSLLIQGYEGSAVSAFIPKMINGKFFELAFMYSMAPSGKGYLKTDRPYAWLAVSPYTGDILFYNDCIYADFVSTSDYPLDSTISLALKEKLDIDEFIKLDEEFIGVYDELRKFVFENKQCLSDSQKSVINRYKELFDTLISPDLLPYYKALSPEFFNWLD